MLTAELLYTFCSATAYLLQRHCKAVAVLLQIYVQCYCKPFAAPKSCCMLTAELLYTFCSATAYLLQRHCKAVAVLLQIYVQCYCKPFAAPLQKACSVFAVGSVCVSVINFFYLREVSEQPVRDSSANMFRQSGRNSHFCFDGLIYICIAHGIGHVVRLMGKEAESCLSIA